jgi:hypothetical protein
VNLFVPVLFYFVPAGSDSRCPQRAVNMNKMTMHLGDIMCKIKYTVCTLTRSLCSLRSCSSDMRTTLGNAY